MSYAVALIYLIFYFIRPHDWIEPLGGLPIAKMILGAGMIAYFMDQKSDEFRKYAVTPVDWAMYALFAFILFFAPSQDGTLGKLLPFIVGYQVISRALDSDEKIRSYLVVWCVLLSIMAFLALGAIYGWDVTNSAPLLDGNKQRLALNTYMQSNPNELGHAVCLVVPLSLVLLIVPGNGSKRFAALLMCAVACWCIYHTESKGSFIACFIITLLVVLTMVPKWLRLSVAVLAVIVGSSALMLLPRMNELSTKEEGIQGRLLAWEQARATMENNATGVGYREFFAWVRWEGELIPKATHGSFVRVGADLGWVGLAVYLALFWMVLRVLLDAARMKTADQTNRAGVLVLWLSLTVSAWMIDRAYHIEVFLVAALASAMWRQNRIKMDTEEEPLFDSKLGLLTAKDIEPRLHPKWDDVVAAGLATLAVVKVWDYILSNQ